MHILRRSIDDALANLDTQISPWKNPAEWLHADTTHLNSVVEEILATTGKTEIEQGKFTGVLMIHQVRCFALNKWNVLKQLQRLVIYILAHLTLCTGEELHAISILDIHDLTSLQGAE
jgi:hypothetical protein